MGNKDITEVKIFLKGTRKVNQSVNLTKPDVSDAV